MASGECHEGRRVDVVQLERVCGEVVELVGAGAVRRVVEVVGGGDDAQGFVGIVLGEGY
jgi:hypothetical protein